jgi:hypothetical protein
MPLPSFAARDDFGALEVGYTQTDAWAGTVTGTVVVFANGTTQTQASPSSLAAGTST